MRRRTKTDGARRIARHNARARVTEKYGHVYCIRAGTSGLLKLGKSHDPWQRLASLRTMSPEPLELLAFQPVEDMSGIERILHREFQRHRTHGEWFRPAPEIFHELLDWFIATGAEHHFVDYWPEKDARDRPKVTGLRPPRGAAKGVNG